MNKQQKGRAKNSVSHCGLQLWNCHCVSAPRSWHRTGPISQAVIILHQWLANHFNIFLIAYFAYRFSTVRLVLVRESCTAINTAIHKMIPLSVMAIAKAMKDNISLHSCTDVTLNPVKNIYNPLFLYHHKNSFSYIFHLVLQTGRTLKNLSWHNYMYLMLQQTK